MHKVIIAACLRLVTFLNSASVVAVSPSGATVSGSTSNIIDARGNPWTLCDRMVAENGTVHSYCLPSKITLLPFLNTTLYEEHGVGWSWNGGGSAQINGSSQTSSGAGGGVVSASSRSSRGSSSSGLSSGAAPKTVSSSACVLSSNPGPGLSGLPMQAPAGSLSVSPGSIQAAVNANPANTSFLLLPGTYTDGIVTVKNGDAFYGQGKATWNGGGRAAALNTGGTTGVTISGIVFTGFNPADNGGGGLFPGGTGLTLEGNTITNNQGTPVQINGRGWNVVNNCIHSNGADGIQSYQSSSTMVSHNEIYGNVTSPTVQNLPPNIAYMSGIKFFDTANATIRYNYVHDNQGVGIWFDTDNTGTVIDGNYVANNTQTAVMDEASYGATISNNTIIGNGPNALWIAGVGIYISTASNVQAYGNVISGNIMGGILIYEDPTRGSGPLGTYQATNENIHDNYITMSQGATVITGGAEKDSTNKFTANHYCLSGSAGFMIGGNNINRLGWQAAGYDTAGTFNCGLN